MISTYIHHGRDEAETLRPEDFTPWAWTSHEDRADIVNQAARNYITERQENHADREPYTFTVYSTTERTPRHANGYPLTVHSTTFSATPQKP